MGLSYRARQFFQALKASPSSVELDQARALLNPALMDLFLRMDLSEQAHSIQVMQKLQKEGHTHPDLLCAALLHDVGKCLYPLRVWERAMIVVAKAFFPRQASRWGHGKARGWKRAFVVANQHPVWGAELAERAGANPTTTQLIRRHQDARPVSTQSFGDQFLFQLQLADDES
jgi:predicted HD phosphohydrolase